MRFFSFIVVFLLFVFACTSTSQQSEGNSTKPEQTETSDTGTKNPQSQISKPSKNHSQPTQSEPSKLPQNSSVETTKLKPEKSTSQISDQQQGTPILSFETFEHDFGEIMQGDTVVVDYKFKNEGDGPLVFNSVKASCGCTQPSYPFIPVPPNEEGKISLMYVSVGKVGPQVAMVAVRTNASNNRVRLKLTGTVLVEDK